MPHPGLKISTSPNPTGTAVVHGRHATRSSHWAILLLNDIAITNNSTYLKIKLDMLEVIVIKTTLIIKYNAAVHLFYNNARQVNNLTCHM